MAGYPAVGTDLHAKWAESVSGTASAGQLYYGAHTDLIQLKETLMDVRKAVKARDYARVSASIRSKRQEKESIVVNNRVHAARRLEANRVVREKEVVDKHGKAVERLKEKAEFHRAEQHAKVVRNAEKQAKACRNRLSYQRHLESIQLHARREAVEKVRKRIAFAESQLHNVRPA